MTRVKYFAGCCVVSVSILFSSALLISACSRNHVTPAKTDKTTTSSQNTATPALVDKSAASPQDTATPDENDTPIAMEDCSKSKKLQESITGTGGLKENMLYLYAVKLFNQPLACKGGNSEDGESAVMVFTFTNGATFKIDYDQSATNYALRVPGGFPDEKEARSIIKQYQGGRAINWAKPDESSDERGEQVNSYWASGTDMNIGVDMVYKAKKLVELRYQIGD